MKSAGIVRKLDDLGRLVILKEIRNVMEINKGDLMEIVQVNNEIVVKKYSRGCIFCGSDKSITEFKEVSICSVCKTAIGKE
ncbi:AbrB family transcriptional regulator [Clostridium chromiireducens]|uniref:AbrB family transcriptional regulator n=1 Tax=Clostridium chromiireducens TaxID=225345 RepID=A0A964W1F2_9CLOT|nr:AbrB/MazE/SpoVT family DNA-binding domain-containing protein [Clostridium chromiireducens]MVX63411.1 AbrB family transcriptional regulator [Clostridium chromiireducens]